jgi:hypothetical protein
MSRDEGRKSETSCCDSLGVSHGVVWLNHLSIAPPPFFFPFFPQAFPRADC